MADIQYSGDYCPEAGYDSGYDYRYTQAPVAEDSSRVVQLINGVGAFVSMGLVVGMAIWAWQLLMRDVTDVPVIRAMQGPMRVAPEDPGGAVAENQGLAVNRLAEGAEAASVPDQLIIAPRPIDLADAPDVNQTLDDASVPEVPEESAQEPVPEVATVDGVLTPDDTEALIERLIAEVRPLDAAESQALPNASEAPSGPRLVAQAEAIPISVPGVRRSPRPSSRPADIQTRAEEATIAAVTSDASDPSVATAPAGEFEIAADELEVGTRLVQLGAFDTPDLARTEWQRLAQTYPDFFLGRARVIEQASSGGQTFYRLRAHGFGDLSASRRFCAALVAQGAACIPVTIR